MKKHWTGLFALLVAAAVGLGPAAAGGLPKGDAATLAFAPDRLARIDAAMQRYVDAGKLAGVTVAIARDGKLAYLHSAGMADREAGRPMAEDTMVRIYSMSKPITAVALMILVEEGKVHLADKLSDYLPEFADMKVQDGEGPDGLKTVPAERPIYVHDLLTHTSGLTYDDYENSPVSKLYKQANIFDPARSLADFSKLIASLPLAVQPGTVYNYGVSLDITGRLIEVVSGQSFGAFLKDNIFEPLGMKDTTFRVPAGKQARFAQLYKPDGKGGLQPMTGASYHARFAPDAVMESGGGGLVSTVDDYLRFCQMLLNGGELDGVRILAPKTVQLMTTGQLPPERRPFLARLMPGYDVGLGVAVLDDLGTSELPGSVGEFNWAGAANTFFFVDPREKVIAVLLTQLMPYGDPPLREDLKAWTYQAMTEAHHAE
ncbi:MAG: serine hydrolase [Alphaproteobacteria bacterium]|nr:serine hydrolase [Alphaproteobacteria bacterium]